MSEKVNITFKSGVTKSVVMEDGNFDNLTRCFDECVEKPDETHFLNWPNFSLDLKEVVMIEKLAE